MTNGTPAFREGQSVRHAQHGMMRIEQCNVPQTGAGYTVNVHVLVSEHNQARIFVPVTKAADVLHVMKQGDLPKNLFGIIGGAARGKQARWNTRERDLKARLNSGSLTDLAKVVRDTCPDDAAGQSYSERELYETAVTRLIGVVAAAYKLSDTEAAALLSKKSGKHIECVHIRTPEHVTSTTADPFAAQPYRRETPDYPSDFSALNGTKGTSVTKPTVNGSTASVIRVAKPEPKPADDEGSTPMDVKQTGESPATPSAEAGESPDIARVRELLAEKTLALTAAEDRATALAGEVDSLSTQLITKARDVASLEERLAASEGTRKRVASELAVREQELNHAQAANEELASADEELKEQLATCQDDLARCTGEVEVLQLALDTVRLERDTAISGFQKLNSELPEQREVPAKSASSKPQKPRQKKRAKPLYDPKWFRK